MPTLLAADLQDHLMTASNDLDRLQRLLADATTTLLQHFHGLSEQIERLREELNDPATMDAHTIELREGLNTDAQAAGATKPDWNGSERRGPKRATNVTRLPSSDPATTPKAVASGGDDWESF